MLIDVLNGSYISLNYLYMSCHNKKFPVLSIQLLFYMEACESGSMFEYLLAKNRNSKQFEPTHRYNNYNSFSLWLNAFTFKLSVHVFTCTLSLPLSLSLSLTSTCIYILIVIYNMNMYSHWMLTPPPFIFSYFSYIISHCSWSFNSSGSDCFQCYHLLLCLLLWQEEEDLPGRCLQCEVDGRLG